MTAPKSKKKEPTKEQAKPKNLASFRAEYDRDFIVPDRIRKALRTLGQAGWEYEVEFSRLAGVSLADLAAYRDKFSVYWVQIKRTGRRAWAGSKALADSMRRMV